MDSDSSATQRAFGQDLINELVDIVVYAFGNISGSIVLVTLIFMLETLMHSSSAKLLFVCGYLILFVIFNTVAVVCFPKNSEGGEGEEEEEGTYKEVGGGSTFTGLHSWLKSRGGGIKLQQEMSPLFKRTRASFYNFSLGYMFGYWANLNILKNTPNTTMNNLYYIAIIFFCYVFSVFYAQACSWESGLISLALGIIGGLVWAQLVSDKIVITTENSSTLGSSTTDTVSTTVNNSIACNGNSNDNMVCNAFRVQ
jgi:hypothetical protein